MQQIDHHLIAKHLDGSTSESEKKTLMSWIAADPRHKVQFEDAEKIWLESQKTQFNAEIVFDKKMAWADFEEKAKFNPSIVSLKQWVVRIAVVLVLGMVAFWGYEQYSVVPQILAFVGTKSNSMMTLSDGSVVALEVGSSLTYAKEFKENRHVTLKGTAFFEVAESKEFPFVIHTPAMYVRVVGTQFYVSSDDQHCSVDVVSGIVEVDVPDGDKPLRLVKNQHLVFDVSTKTFGSVEEVDVNDAFWKTGLLEFQSTPLAEVFYTLRKAYDKEIYFDSAQVEGCLFSGKFKDASFLEILKQLRLSLGVEYTVSDAVQIVKTNCK